MLVSHRSVLCMPLSVYLRQCVSRWMNDLCAGHVLGRMCSSAMYRRRRCRTRWAKGVRPAS